MSAHGKSLAYQVGVAVLTMGLTLAPDAGATIIPANFVQAFRPPNVPTTLPALLVGGSNSVTLQFFVPDFASIVSINSIEVSVDVSDDAADGGESGVVRLGTDGPNPDISSFGTLGGPTTVTGFVGAGDLPTAEAEIIDNGFFRIRVRRETGDFNVDAGRISIDADLRATADGPPTVLLLAVSAGVMGLMASRRRARR